MKREDVGELSPDEADLLPTTSRRQEMVENFLYYALSAARSARERMERMRNPMSDAFLYAKIERDGAMQNARENLEKLRAVGWEPDPVLASMIEWEAL
jgi:hypothetical protein